MLNKIRFPKKKVTENITAKTEPSLFQLLVINIKTFRGGKNEMGGGIVETSVEKLRTFKKVNLIHFY